MGKLRPTNIKRVNNIFGICLFTQISPTGVLDSKKIEADFVKGVNDKNWAPLVTAAIKKCDPLVKSKF
jgi:hypothetical protein